MKKVTPLRVADLTDLTAIINTLRRVPCMQKNCLIAPNATLVLFKISNSSLGAV